VLHQLDLSSLQSVRDFCSKIIETEPRLDVLIHNAGVYAGALNKFVSVDGIELTMATNHYGPFLMTHLLIDLLKKSAPARIVVVSSKAHTLSFMDPTEPELLNPVNYWIPQRIYFNSKMANIWFTIELARRLQGTGVTCNALHPGSISSEIWRYHPFPINISVKLIRMTLKTLEEGIQTTIMLALSTNLEHVSGHYYRNCKPGKPHRDAYKVEWQKIMWEESKKMVKLTENDPKI
jgi:NAD(P)-dependent dehydrogenase (short-subunit alcohol dehydrogenase family)